MRVYVETNFLLELAFAQPHAEACEALIQLAEARTIQLAIPVFCFVEAAETRRRRIGVVRTFSQAPTPPAALNQLPWVQRAVDAFRDEIMREVAETSRRLAEVHTRMMQVAIMLPLDHAALTQRDTLEVRCGLDPPDAAVLASMMVAMRAPAEGAVPSVLLNSNTRDFDDKPVRELLAEHGVQLIPSFREGLNFVRRRLGQD